MLFSYRLEPVASVCCTIRWASSLSVLSHQFHSFAADSVRPEKPSVHGAQTIPNGKMQPGTKSSDTVPRECLPCDMMPRALLLLI